MEGRTLEERDRERERERERGRKNVLSVVHDFNKEVSYKILTLSSNKICR